jgi:hypothetical protein
LQVGVREGWGRGPESLVPLIYLAPIPDLSFISYWSPTTKD